MAKLTRLWSAFFEDGHVIDQPEDDRYSKHDDKADWNPSAFRDVLEYKKAPLLHFALLGPANNDIYSVDLDEGTFRIGTKEMSLEVEPLENRKLIYYREMERRNVGGIWLEASVKRYALGYEGKDARGKVVKHVIFLDA